MSFGEGERPRAWTDDVEIEQVLTTEGRLWVLKPPGSKPTFSSSSIQEVVKAFCERRAP